MNKSNCICLIAALSTGLLVSPLCAQTANGDQTSTNAQVSSDLPSVNTADSDLTSSDSGEQEVQYAPVLDGSGLIAMDGTVSKRILLGASGMTGWDSNPDNLGKGASSGVYILSPYLGVQANTARMQLLLQYQPTITGYTSSAYSNQRMHAASATILDNVSERWKLDLKASGNYGQDSIRLLAPQQSVAVGEVPGVGPNSSSYLPDAGTVTYLTGSAGVKYRKSERDSIEFDVANTYGHYSGLGKASSIATSRLGYERDLSATAGIRVYGQAYAYYGAINCESYGGGVAVKWRASDATYFSLSGGPQLNTSACGRQQGFSYSAAFSTRLTGKSQLYMLAGREPTISYLGPGLWETSISGGYQRQVTSVGTVSIDVGHASSDSLTATSSYHGTFFDCIYNYHLGHGLSGSYSYRGYVGDTGGTSFSRNVALFSLSWTPSTGRLFQ